MIAKAEIVRKTPPFKGEIIPNVRVWNVDAFIVFAATYASVNSKVALSITVGEFVLDANMLWIEVPWRRSKNYVSSDHPLLRMQLGV